MISKSNSFSRRAGTLLLVGTVLSGSAAPLLAQAAPAAQQSPVPAGTQPAPAAAQAGPAAAQPAPVQNTLAPTPAPAAQTIRSIAVRGNQRLEAETIRAYASLAPGQTYTAATLDQALKDLYATQLFADAKIEGAQTGDLVLVVRENPVINRVILEGNKRLKNDKITPEIKLSPRQIFTRSAVRADVDRILELYRRQGRFAARVLDGGVRSRRSTQSSQNPRKPLVGSVRPWLMPHVGRVLSDPPRAASRRVQKDRPTYCFR